MFRRSGALAIVVALVALLAFASPADAGIIQDLAALKVEIAHVQGRADQFQTDYGSILTPAQQADLTAIKASLQQSQNKCEELMAKL